MRCLTEVSQKFEGKIGFYSVTIILEQIIFCNEKRVVLLVILHEFFPLVDKDFVFGLWRGKVDSGGKKYASWKDE